VKQLNPASDCAVEVSRETEQLCRSYLALLLRWNTRINLVARMPEPMLWQRHVLDSLQLVPLVPGDGQPLLDIGSGAGLPGLIIAAATGRETHLVEADQRKAAFLREAVRVLSLRDVHVHATRIEATALPPMGLVTARAVAPLDTLLHLAQGRLAPQGVALFPKGRSAESELTEASRRWTMIVERFPSRTDPDSTIFRIRDIQPAPVPPRS
jgi:16S rRNA (guanine(527)-N(7))-methyltransferase RsmG